VESSTLEIIAAILGGAGIASLGAAVSFGGLGARVAQQGAQLARIMGTNRGGVPDYITREECVVGAGKRQRQIDAQDRLLRRLENFARWQLAKKEGLTLPEIEDVFRNGGE
jgi:hypothetical protein